MIQQVIHKDKFEEYRFGFQGQEKDNEWTGTEGSHLAFKYRVHDARIGRFLSIDPLTAKYPHNSPYAFSENRVIDGVELEGLERLSVHTPGWTFRSKTVLRNEAATSTQQKFSTAGVAFKHFNEAREVGKVKYGSTNISTVAGRFARHVAENKNMTVEIGSERNAFRHTFWQAIITNEFDADIAHKIGNAHEGIPLSAQDNAYVNFGVPAPDNMAAADDVVDFLNNQIGRNIANEMGEGASRGDIAKEVLRTQRDEGLWTATETENGISISRTKITEKQYNTALEILNGLDENGMNSADRKELGNE